MFSRNVNQKTRKAKPTLIAKPRLIAKPTLCAYAALIACAAFLLAACATGDRANTKPASETVYRGELGSVKLDVSCTAGASDEFHRGLALMHHMTYEGAADAFRASAAIDPSCAMAKWGVAMTFIHPLWSDPPTEAEFLIGSTAIAEASTAGERTDLEDAFISAADAYYTESATNNEKPRLLAFASAWRDVHDRFGGHDEALAFHALSNLATADPTDKTYKTQLASGALAERLLERNPTHPGGLHYAIHSYDYPPLAEKAIEIARTYGSVAPDVSHALHMPTHIFTRLGLWDDSIEFNRRAADAAKAHPAGDLVSLHYPHALDYLVYSFLQKGEDTNAFEVFAEMKSITGAIQTHLASAYTLASVPVRLALERHRWSEAAELEPRVPSRYNWDSSPASEAIVYFARALGNARSGNTTAAARDLAKVESLRDLVVSDYWRGQVEIQRLSAQAWIEFAEGARESGLATMIAAANQESLTEKHPVTPGEVLPANELLGDMYMELGRYGESLAAYRTSLQRSPRRLNSLFGAAQAAAGSGDETAAREYYGLVLDVAGNADNDVEAVQTARRYIAGSL